MLTPVLHARRYLWPPQSLAGTWSADNQGNLTRSLPESAAELAADSRWPALFPSPICLVTTTDGRQTGLEKVVGASIVNRFPYLLALSFCRQSLSARHHVRREFTDLLERGGAVAVQYLPPGPNLDHAMRVIAGTPEEQTGERLARTGLPTRPATTNPAPVFAEAYLVYEARLVKPGHDFEGQPIFPEPWLDVGSHRVYFLEINAIQLREDIARGQSQIRWRALPAWTPQLPLQPPVHSRTPAPDDGSYKKGYTPDYAFPSAGTIAFAADEWRAGMAVKHLPPLPKDQVEVDNDKARWPCFFPSSVGMITSWSAAGHPNLMPCGSTTILSRHPLIIAPCVSYARINVRYAPRASLADIRRTRRFGCGVPYVSDLLTSAIRSAGNVSIGADPEKIAHAGLAVTPNPTAPDLPAMPVHFDCAVIGEHRLGTHVLFLGEVKQIRVRADVTPSNPLEWCPWAAVTPVEKS